MKGFSSKPMVVPLAIALVAVAALVFWLTRHPESGLQSREPGADSAPSAQTGGANPVLAGKVITGSGQHAELPGDWPQFRGPDRDGKLSTRAEAPAVSLSRDWSASPPRELWAIDVGEGYAGPVVRDGRVYLLDYDAEPRQSALRCLSLADGKEIWRFAYPLTVKRNHGMSRTVPVVTDELVVALDPKCNVLCVDARTGELRWSLDLVREFGATVPEWYAGQCPLVDGDKVILAPGGTNALLLAVELSSGKLLWQTPNPRGWKMTHSSIMPMEFAGARFYVYCASSGVAGVNGDDGSLLWETTEWKISIATVPSPLPLPDGRIFFSGGYNAGSLMLGLATTGDGFTPKTSFRLPPEAFGATQHTPIFKDGHIYGARADGRFVCLDLNGGVLWTSGPGETFGLGSFLMAGDLILALNDSGKLRLIEATPARFNLLGEARVLQGRESWGPMALAHGRLLARDLTRMVCLDVSGK